MKGDKNMNLREAVNHFENKCDHQCAKCLLGKEDEQGISARAHINRAEALVYDIRKEIKTNDSQTT